LKTDPVQQHGSLLAKMSADIFFYGLFGVIAAFCSLVEYGNQKQAGAENKSTSYTSAFLTFRNNYLTVYALMMAGDWLQGMSRQHVPQQPATAAALHHHRSFAFTSKVRTVFDSFFSMLSHA
jgi:hypothetical protein